MQKFIHRSNHKGFTLIELLIVIAIIAILAAILFPVFARARESARRASCQSNLKQLSLAIAQYTQDYDEKFPRWRWNSTGSWGWTGWAVQLYTYTNNLQVLQCPSEVNPPNGNNGHTAGYSDYFYNDNVGKEAGAINLSQLDAAPLTILLGDSRSDNGANNTSGGAGSNGGGKAVAVDDWDPNRVDTAERHLEGANYAFADGHVKWYQPEKITKDATGTGNPTFRFSNTTNGGE